MHVVDSVVVETRAMGSHVRLVVVGGDDATAPRIIERIGRLEQHWSRFRTDSDIGRLNRSAGCPISVSRDTLRLVATMIDGNRATTGCFDPTLLVPVVAIGYGSSWDGSGASTDVKVDLDHRGSVNGIIIDHESSTVRLPVGTALDAGGVGKGLAGDIIAEEFVGNECRGLLISIGGDVVVAGDAPEGHGWTVSISDPRADHEVDRIHLAQGAVATSSTEMRVFERGHHLVDPSTLRSVDNGVRSATVVAGSGAWAEMLTKFLVVEGPHRLDDLDRVGVAASTTTNDGRAFNAAWRQLAVGS